MSEYKANIILESQFKIKETFDEKNIDIDEEEVKAKVSLENQYKIEDTTKENTIKILMLKGEKGDTGAGDIWGNIEGNISDQQDLQQALANAGKVKSFELVSGWPVEDDGVRMVAEFENVPSGVNNVLTIVLATQGTLQAVVGYIMENFAQISDIPTSTSDLTNDSDFVSDASYQHTDNNYTNAEKNKLSGIATGAEVNVIESVKVNGSALSVVNKAVDVPVPSQNLWYGTCSTASATASKETTITGFPSTLTAGIHIAIKFTYANGVANPTLSINNGTAIAIKRYGTTAPSTSAASSWQANSVVEMVYDGTYWQIVNWLNTTYSAISQANIENTSGTSSGLITGTRFTQGFNARLTSTAIVNALGYTPYNSSNPNGYTSNAGTLTGITMNGSSKGSSGVVDLGNVVTPDNISNYTNPSRTNNYFLAGLSAVANSATELRIQVPIPSGYSNIVPSIVSGAETAQLGYYGASGWQSITMSNVTVLDINPASVTLTITTSGLTAYRNYVFRNGYIQIALS